MKTRSDGPQGEPAAGRRSLTNVGGGVEVETAPHLLRGQASYLETALDVAPAGEDALESERAHVHGFHTYPARLHPTIATRLIEALTKPEDTVWDPFCGSGTVLVSSLLTRRNALGSDLNPLAVLLAQAKTRMRSEEEIQMIEREAIRARTIADERRKKRAGVSRRYGPDDVAAFEPHVLCELDSLRTFIENDPALNPKTRDDLRLVLSAMLVKVSRMRADTSQAQVAKRHYPGFPARFFQDKAREWGERLLEFQRLRGRGSARVAIASATDAPKWKPKSVHAIVTSPPYAGTYDYVEHHALRLRWLGLAQASFAKGELGARRRYSTLPGSEEASKFYRDEMASCFRAWTKVLVPGARIAIMVADSAGSRFAVRADVVVRQAADLVRGYRFEARASQVRPHFHAPSQQAFTENARREHVIVLRYAP